MGQFADFDRVVMEFMNEMGFTATFVHQVSSTPNNTTNTPTVVTESTPVQAIRMELIRPTEGSGTKTATTIQDGDLTLFVRPTEKTNALASPLSIKPSTDKFIINGVTWKVVTVKEHNPSSSDCILYEFYIRK